MLAAGSRVGVRELGGDVPASLGCADLGAERVVPCPVSAPEGPGGSEPSAAATPVWLKGGATFLRCEDLGPGTNPQQWHLPRLQELEIPSGVKVRDYWPEQLKELADFTSPHIALVIADQFGGQNIYIPINWETCRFRHVISDEFVQKICAAYGPYEYFVPRARTALTRARREGLIAAVRAGTLSKRNAAIILGTSRNYLHQIVRHTGEGADVSPVERLPLPRAVRLVRTSAEIAADHLRQLGFSDEQIAAVTTEILELLD